MAKLKYSLTTKLAVINHYLSGHDGTQRTAERFGVERTAVRRWVRAWQFHGIDGLVRPTQHHPAEFRLVVVQAVLNEKLSMREAAARFNISAEMTVRYWLNVYKTAGPDGLMNMTRGRSGKMAKKTPPASFTDKDLSKLSPEELMAELRYLRAENDYLKKLKALDLRERRDKKPS